MNVIEDPVTVRLELESHPENVALVRSAVSGIAEAVRLGAELTADLKTAVSEACNNVALHAYDGGSGPMIVEIDRAAGGIDVAVIDRGHGITRISGGEDRMGLGLAVISALADSSEFRRPEGGGTEVRMWFRASAQSAERLDHAEVTERINRHLSHLDRFGARADDEILISFAPVGMARYVLGRMVQSLAAASHFSVAKIDDLRSVNEAIARYIEDAAEGGVSIAIASSSRRLSMTTGPLPAHDPESARAALASIVDGLSSERETIRIELLDGTRDAAA